MANLVVELEGQGTATLSASNHLATGGEASVYKHGKTVIKVYTDSDKMSRDGMVDKVDLLKGLGTETIIAPQGVVYNKKTSKPVGFFLPFVQGEAMARVFTTAWWKRSGFTPDLANIAVEKMRKAVEHAHANNAVMVDANELNWMLSVGSDPLPLVIDVDSWAIGKWGASVIMPSIRDFHTKGFDAKSDWFSWGVVTFQIYTGIHPYRGMLDGYSPADWPEKRMRDKASVFAPDVRLNAAVRDFNLIPNALRGWYEAVFQKGERTLPPSPFAVAGVQRTAVVRHVSVGISTGALVIDKIFDIHPVLRTWPCGAALVRVGNELQVFDVKRKKKLFDVPPYMRFTEVIRVEDGFVLTLLEGPSPRFLFADDWGAPPTPLDLKLNGHALFRSENRLFLATDTNLVELSFLKMAKPTLAVKQQISVLHPQAVQWFDGVGVEKAFASTFILTPFRDKACATLRVPELDGLQILDAKAGPRFAAFLGEDSLGNTHKIELAFDADHTKYTVWKGKSDVHDLNMSCLPKGVNATIVKDGELVIFVPSNSSATQVRKISDKLVSTSMELGNFDDTVICVDKGAIYTLKVR